MRFEFDAERYQQASAHQQQWGQRLIAELSFQGHERILDVGSGDGSLTAKLAAVVPYGLVLGIDTSTQMVQAAKRFEGPNLAFRVLDILEADFREEFDVVFSNATLHWVQDHQRLLDVLHRALQPGGVVRLNFAGDGNCSHLIAVLRGLMAMDEFREAFEGFRWPWYMPAVEEYEQLAERSAFTEVRVWGEHADQHFPHVEAMVGWIDQPSLVPFLQHLGSEAGRRFREAVVVRMIEATKESDGRCFETFRRINVVARKLPARQA